MSGWDQQDGDGARVSVRDLLSVPSFGLRVLAAPGRVDSPVRWAHPTELLDPRAYLSGQELVLTVGTSLVDDTACQRFVEHLVEAGVSALGYGVGDVTDEVPAALVQACRDADLPLVEVPPKLPFQAITEMLADHRAEARAARGRRVQRLAAKLLDAIAQGRSMDDLLALIDADLGGHAAFEDGNLRWRPATDADVRPGDDTLAHLASVLAVRKHEEDLDQTNRRLEVGRLLQLVVEGRADAEVLQLPVQGAGLDPARPVVPAVWPARAADLVAPGLAPALVAEYDDLTITLSADPLRPAAVAADRALPCGIGEAVPVAQLRRVVPPAVAAFRLACTRGEPVDYRDLVTFEGLLEQQPAGRLAPYADRLIVPLVQHDHDHGSALVHTLRTFLEEDGSANAAARTLFLHPNSLRHRLKRIQELTGANPRSFDDRVALAIGLWAWERRPRGRR